MSRLWWLPTDPNWKAKVKAVDKTARWSDLKALACAQFGFSESLQLDRRLGKLPLAEMRPAGMDGIRLAMISGLVQWL